MLGLGTVEDREGRGGRGANGIIVSIRMWTLFITG